MTNRLDPVPVPQSLDQLIEGALASTPNERVERYRDRLAAFGNEAVEPLLALERRHPPMGLFVTTVLEAAVRNGADDARAALDVLAAFANSPTTRTAARDATERTGTTGKTATRPPQATVDSARRPRPPEETIQLINAARMRRGEPQLDAAEARQVLGNLERRAADPHRYRNVCWKCSAAVDAATNESCAFCQWLVCWCGGCRAPHYVDRTTGLSGHCRREVWLVARERASAQEVIDVDYQGVPILTSGPPSSDAKLISALLARHGLQVVFHWTPLRNLRSVLERGLLSREALARSRIPVVPHGYGSVDKEEALRDYVCVSLAPKPWMMHRWSETPVVLELERAALLAEGTLFVPGNSASRLFATSELLMMKGAPSVEGIFSAGSITPQAEAWIPMAVPRIAIRRIHTKDPSTAEAIGGQTDLQHLPPVSATPEFFVAESLESPT